MKKYLKFLAPTLALLIIAAFGVCRANAFMGGCDDGHRGQRLQKLTKALGLSEQQKQQIKAIFQENRTQAEPTIKQMVAECRALRNLVRADSVDEAAIRAQAAKVAAIQADMAVRRAQIFQKIRTVLKPEQVEKFKALQEKRDGKMDKCPPRGRCCGPLE